MPRWKLILACALLCGLFAVFVPLMQGIHRHTQADTAAFRQWVWPARQAWCIQLGAFDSREKAMEFARQTQALGQAGYVLPGTVYRCLGDWYESEAEAQAQLDILQASGWEQACLYALSRPVQAAGDTCTQQEVTRMLSADQALWDAARLAARAAQAQSADLSALSQSQMRAARVCARIGGVSDEIAPLADPGARLRHAALGWALTAIQGNDMQAEDTSSVADSPQKPSVG